MAAYPVAYALSSALIFDDHDFESQMMPMERLKAAVERWATAHGHTLAYVEEPYALCLGTTAFRVERLLIPELHWELYLEEAYLAHGYMPFRARVLVNLRGEYVTTEDDVERLLDACRDVRGVPSPYEVLRAVCNIYAPIMSTLGSGVASKLRQASTLELHHLETTEVAPRLAEEMKQADETDLDVWRLAPTKALPDGAWNPEMATPYVRKYARLVAHHLRTMCHPTPIDTRGLGLPLDLMLEAYRYGVHHT